MAKSYSVTSAGVNPAEDRAHRMRVYFITMSLRVVCVASLFFVRGWWVLLAGAGAVLLPYFAVMIANAVAHTGGEHPEAPEPLQLTGAGAEPEETGREGSLIVVDAPADRRASPPDAAEPEPAAESRDGASPGEARAEPASADPGEEPA
ncbi:DUF3099 domain-containing protein [Leucobacter sp. CSA1]|uniref:DUF3099 domain-containing protein n=1 Tax=Leucobacter chromiisoli TaxID=2796471 RepID=A0A934Q415_9MICO|nr:DUF3099 domain-containing protein [Leucobacter chromiisoli]MBK0417974.1 DUF3099 domain-containing protein [Leucobacter chromiisoli]